MVMTASELVCMQHNFFATVLATALLQAELWRVESDHRALFGGQRNKSWTITTFGYTPDRFALAASSELERLKAPTSNPTDEEADETLIAALRALRQELNKGDILLVENDQTITSPIGALPVVKTERGMKVIQYGMVVKDQKMEALFDGVSSPKVRFINEAHNLAISMIASAANVKLNFK